LTEVVFLRRAGKNRIEASNQRFRTECQLDQSIVPAPRPPRSQAGARLWPSAPDWLARFAYATAGVLSTNPRACRGSRLPIWRADAVSAISTCSGQWQCRVVLERQSDGVVERKIELAIAQKLVDSPGVCSKFGGGDAGR